MSGNTAENPGFRQASSRLRVPKAATVRLW